MSCAFHKPIIPHTIRRCGIRYRSMSQFNQKNLIFVRRLKGLMERGWKRTKGAAEGELKGIH